MRISPPDAWAFGRVVCGQSLNGELHVMAEPWKTMAVYLAALPIAERQIHLQAMLAARPDHEAFVKALADENPLGPAPQGPIVRFATAADIRRNHIQTRSIWEGWIPASSVIGIAAPEGVGKTRFLMDLLRRSWHGLPWPDGQAMTLPPRTPAIWMCADGNQDEIVAMLSEFNLPDEAVVFPAPPGDPYANTDLDSAESLNWIDDAIGSVLPVWTAIDSLTYATVRDLCEQRSVAILKTPLVDLVQQYQTNVFLSLHVSKDGQALGKRIRGITRTLIHLECPDAEQSHRLRAWVEKSYTKKPPALGVTMHDAGNDYDFNPPARPDPSKGGRPPEKREKAMQFIRDALTRQNDQIANDLCARWTVEGGSEKTFWRGVEAMKDAGDLTSDGGKGTGKQTVLHLIDIKPTQTP
jgi:AAA domain